MIAIFTVLGLLLFGGGVFAIYDGWPYLVLERGFTEVIIGAIASSAGLIMLSLAWVLKEVRATRRALLEAIELRPQAPLPVVTVEEAPLVAPVLPESPAFSRAVVPAAIGAVAGAAATSAVAQALAGSDHENAPAPAETPASPGDRDLFGALVTQQLQEPELEPATESEPEEGTELVPVSAEEAPPLPDIFDEALSTPSSEPAETQAKAELDVPQRLEPVAATPQPDHDEWTFPVQAEPAPSEEPVPHERPATPVSAADIPAETGDHAELDEFSALRASLAGHLDEPEADTGRIEPSFSREPDPFAAAETWMDRASPRREPWLDTPPAEEPPSVDEDAPLWPPRTEAPAFEAPAEPAYLSVEAETLPDAIEAPAHESPAHDDLDDEAPARVSAEAVPEPAIADAPQPEDAPVAVDSRPASDEGIVGAYQVGDAHFTIFADGSIRARTPDGEYSFASMDELKVYLASEKSRLGV
ncbi:MAG: hypothetical protein EOP23_01140 [Hyphomicrobiales bacterium]|nr:MAG: hypothetical protein EOP23_01140 [Hyphomicrobiales bacterium]